VKIVIPVIFPNLLDIIRGGIQFLIDSIMYWLGEAWKGIYNAFVSFANWVYGGLEWLYNTIRPHLAIVLTILFSLYSMKKIIGSENIGFLAKLLGVLGAPFLSYIAAEILTSFLPLSISLPRIELLPPDIILDEVVKHEQLVVDETELISKLINVRLIDSIDVSDVTTVELGETPPPPPPSQIIVNIVDSIDISDYVSVGLMTGAINVNIVDSIDVSDSTTITLTTRQTIEINIVDSISIEDSVTITLI